MPLRHEGHPLGSRVRRSPRSSYLMKTTQFLKTKYDAQEVSGLATAFETPRSGRGDQHDHAALMLGLYIASLEGPSVKERVERTRPLLSYLRHGSEHQQGTVLRALQGHKSSSSSQLRSALIESGIVGVLPTITATLTTPENAQLAHDLLQWVTASRSQELPDIILALQMLVQRKLSCCCRISRQ